VKVAEPFNIHEIPIGKMHSALMANYWYIKVLIWPFNMWWNSTISFAVAV